MLTVEQALQWVRERENKAIEEVAADLLDLVKASEDRKRILRLWTAVQEARDAFHEIVACATIESVKQTAIAQRALDNLPEKP